MTVAVYNPPPKDKTMFNDNSYKFPNNDDGYVPTRSEFVTSSALQHIPNGRVTGVSVGPLAVTRRLWGYALADIEVRLPGIFINFILAQMFRDAAIGLEGLLDQLAMPMTSTFDHHLIRTVAEAQDAVDLSTLCAFSGLFARHKQTRRPGKLVTLSRMVLPLRDDSPGFVLGLLQEHQLLGAHFAVQPL